MTEPRLKVCTICKDPKDIEDFNKKKRSPDGRQPHCRECNRKASKRYYADNKEHHKNIVYKRKTDQREETQKFVLNYLKEHPCVDCEEKDPVVLDFDHVRGKKFRGICQMVRHGNSLDLIKLEIEKCEVRCANCHRRKTAKDFKYYNYVNGFVV
jgi:hypothetical protein